MNIKQLVLLPLLFIVALATAQEKHTISGYVKDADSGETLIGVTVLEKNLETGTTTNAYGFYSLTLPAGEVELTYSYLGFDDTIEKLTLNQDTPLNIDLGTSPEQLVEVVVRANSAKEQVRSTQMSVDRISMKEAKALPALFGEVDIIKTLQLKPGVSSGGEGTSGLIVRGGGPDQNLIVLDEAIVYNPSHLFGFFSTFNSDAVKDVQLYKGGFPAQYGGRLSSVIDVKLREGNRKKFAATGGVGLISSRLTLEGPTVKNKGSFIVSGRRTYVDIFTRAVNRSNADNPDAQLIPDYFFYDLNAKVNYDLGEKDRIFLSGYFGRDAFLFDDETFNFKFDWGNITTTARWNHIYNPRLFSNMTFTFSDYDYLISNSFDVFDFEIGSGIRDYNFKMDFYAEPDSRNSIKFGADWTFHEFNVGRLQFEQDGESIFNSSSDFSGWEANAYISDDLEVSKKLKLNIGLRLSSFYSDSTPYFGLEPRFSARYSVSDNLSIKTSYTRMFQYIHLVSSSGASLPTDIWYPSNSVVKPQISDQVAVGASIAIGNQFLLTNELYYKWQQRQVDFRDGADLFINPNLNDEFVFGRGYSYGNEIYLEKKGGKFTGWVGYTLSWTWRDFDAINNGERFPATYDRRHDASVVMLYELNRKFTFTGAWVYNTGRATSLPEARFFLQDITGGQSIVGGIGTIFQERNSFRMNPYHRLDLGIVMKLFLNRPNFEADLTLNTYNTYDRRNPYFIYFETETDENDIVTGIAGKQVSLFPILPSLTFNFKF